MSSYLLGANNGLDAADMEILRAMMSGEDDGDDEPAPGYELGAGPWELGADAWYGAAPRARRWAPRQMLQPQPAPVPMQRPPMRVRSKRPENARLFPIGFESSTPVPAGSTVSVQTQPQDLFKCRKFVVPSSVAPNFKINDIKVGNISQFSSSSPVHAEAFTPDSVDCQVEFDTSAVSQIISVIAQNISGGDEFFYAIMYGYVARY